MKILIGIGMFVLGLVVGGSLCQPRIQHPVDCKCKPEIRGRVLQASFCSRETRGWEQECLYK
jgi:hypothetical protein